MGYDRRLDRVVGHDYPGVRTPGFVQWEFDELELGARAAMALDDPEQAWWELIGTPMLRKMEREEAEHSRDSYDSGVGCFPPKYVQSPTRRLRHR